MKIAVTLCTRQRPVMLRNCLQSLVAQRVPDDVSFSVVVVENNETDACRVIVEAIASQAAAPRIDYAHEPRLGIPIARNRALDVALAQNPDWIAFIDDDEVAGPDWISRFSAAARTLDADVLYGPVEQIDEETGARANVKSRRHRPTGTRVQTVPTNNTLMRAHISRPEGMGLRFDENMRFTGGSDTDFFYRATDRGAVILSVDDAVIQEIVPSERLSLQWQLQRARRTAANVTNIHIRRKRRMRAIAHYGPKCLRRLLRACIQFPVGVVLYPIKPDTASRITTDAFCLIWWVAGCLGVTFNIVPEPYRTIEGS